MGDKLSMETDKHSVVSERNTKSEKAVVAGICRGGVDSMNVDDTTEETLNELCRLVETAGGEVVARAIQNKNAPDSRSFFGKGKVAELAETCKNLDADLLVVDDDLTPSQLRNLEEDCGVRVLDRTMLILDIFALHAKTAEGKLQVELAQLNYLLPRLTGKGTEMSRTGAAQGQGLGTRGPGETKLETDRRHIRRRLGALRRELDDVRRVRQEQRRLRQKQGIKRVSLVGYTNAGKSTLLNYLTGAGVLVEDKLFATLDPTTRRLEIPGRMPLLVTDTVGFIRKLPHHLVESFRSTLDEVADNDVLLHLVDASSPEWEAQREVVLSVLKELDAGDKPVLTVFNKCDLAGADEIYAEPDSCRISALDGRGAPEMLQKLADMLERGLHRLTIRLPAGEGKLLNMLYKDGNVLEMEYDEQGGATALIEADDKLYGKLRGYQV